MLAGSILAFPCAAAAEPSEDGSVAGEAETKSPAATPGSTEEERRRVQVAVPRTETRGRASSVVERVDLEERLPRSAPDALRYEPGVFIQQTAHGQASPYIRGLTGQQTVMFFDGVRMNNSTFRQGPNQYFFTVDSRSIARLEVLRGSASTRWGSDAIGGALLSTPIDPRWGDPEARWNVHGRGAFRTGTADAEIGGRGQLELVHRNVFGILAGFGYRALGQLRSGGPVIAPGTGLPQKIPPAFEADGKTQKGTGFDELTADVRARWNPRPQDEITVAYYDYRQFDVPRTDRCPPPTAPLDECLRYDRQYRTLVYGAYAFRRKSAAVERGRVTLSYQRQLEDGDFDRGSPSTTRLFSLDVVHSLGSSVVLETRAFDPAPWFRIAGRYGVDAYYDRIRSEMQLYWEDVGIRYDLSRGQYLDGGQYLTSGAWAQAETEFWQAIRLRVGGRAALVHARAEGDATTESTSVKQTWGSAVGNAGLWVEAVPGWDFSFNADQGFRAPNLDDLTSRQQTGPGFQFENAELDPERSTTLEAGTRVRTRWLDLDAWLFQTTIRDLIGRVQRTVDECPQNAPGCEGSQTRFQLANLRGVARLRGVEGSLGFRLPLGFWGRATVAWARGEQPNPFGSAAEGNERVPMSRVPPLHGTGELGWRSAFGLGFAGAVRWATLQDRLAPQDVADPRIPRGGTPGYVVFDVRLHYRWRDAILFAAVLENIGDVPWRTHGSSINGPGRSITMEAQFGF